MYVSPEECVGKSIQYYPLLDWTDEDVAEFISERGVRCHPLYYDESGAFHPERRLGCMCCPLMSRRKRLESFRRNPRMVRFYIRNGAEYWRTHPDSSLREYFADVYEQFVCDVFCKDVEDFRERFSGIDCKSFLEGEFGVGLDF